MASIVCAYENENLPLFQLSSSRLFPVKKRKVADSLDPMASDLICVSEIKIKIEIEIEMEIEVEVEGRCN